MKNFFTFVAGLVIGSVATYMVVKDKFEKIAQEEIDSVKEVFGRRVEKEADKKVEKIAKKEVEKIRKEYNEYNDLTKNYTSYSKNKTEENVEEAFEDDEDKDGVELNEIERASDYDRPYIIEPQEFGALDGYSLITLYHYSDNVLADDCDELVEDLDDVVGKDYAEHFGEYEDDCVYVRNDRLKADYEICRDLRKYSDVLWNPSRRY